MKPQLQQTSHFAHHVEFTPADAFTCPTVPFICGQSISISLAALSLSQLPSLLVFLTSRCPVRPCLVCLLAGILALTLPVASETREQESERRPQWGWENNHPPVPPPLLAPPSATSLQHQTPANWFHVCPRWAGIKVCKG